MTVIDVHTHMLDRGWLRLLKEKGAPRYDVGPISETMARSTPPSSMSRIRRS